MSWLMRFAALCLMALSASPRAQSPDARPTAPDFQPLHAGSVISRSGSTAEIHQYAVDLDANAVFEISVTQDAAEVSLSAFGPDGSEITSIDLPTLHPLPEPLMFISATAGRHLVHIRLTEKDETDSPDHQYIVRVHALGRAGERERDRQRCFEMTARGAIGTRRGSGLGDLGKAIQLLRAAASCWQERTEADMETAALTSFARLAGLFSEFRLEAAAAYERLIPLLRAAGHAALVLRSLDELLTEYNDDGRFDRSRAIAIEMRELAAKLGDRPREGRAFRRIAFAEFSLGNYDAARRAALSALDIASALKDVGLQANIYLQLGQIDELAGDFDAALARYEQALRVAPSDRSGAPAALNALGFIRLRRGEYDEAARQFEARLAIAPRFVQRDTEALARVGLGDVRLARGDRAGAAQMYTAAAEALRRGIPRVRCIAIQRLGRYALAEGRLAEAAKHFAEMLTINQQMGNPPCEAEAQAGIADVAFRRGDLEAADAAARQVIQIAEQFREAAPSLESRALGFGALAPAFDRAVEISMHRAGDGDPSAAGRALVLNERALARGLLDHISQLGWDDSGPSGDGAERQRIREQWRVRVAQFQVAQTLGDRERTETLRQEMTTLDLHLRDLEARGDGADLRRARLIRPQALEVEGIQALLDDDTTLIEYALGERQSYLWVVSARDMQSFRLAPRAEIESAARAVHRDLTTPSAAAIQPEALERRRTLSRLVLAPAMSLLTGRRLVVVSAGALTLVPFSILPLDRDPPDDASLHTQFEIVHVPSATTLAAMRALTERRPRPSKHTVVFADPIFEVDDPRASQVPAKGSRSRAVGRGGAGDTRSPEGVAARTLSPLGASFPRLPFSRGEAAALRALAPRQVTMFLDGDATRDRALGQALGDYRFIHFATHGVVHPEVPSLSSIVLSFVDGAGTKHDPFLTLPDIYEMRLGADVVVLSACSTAEGRHVPGEGPIGLARAFMYAGAPRVVATLWRVNDMATAELMKRFYRGMLIDGLPAAAALRAAQQQIAAIPKWASPYYWAPFVLQGDWR